MDNKDIEKKLKDLRIPSPDKERKEAAIMASLKEFEGSFEAAAEEKKSESKGFWSFWRQRDKEQHKTLSKGAPLMTRPIYKPISVAVVAVLLIYGYLFIPELYSEKDASLPAMNMERERPAVQKKADNIKQEETSHGNEEGSEGFDKAAPTKSKTAQVKRRGLTPSDFPLDTAAGGIAGSRHNLGAYGVHFRADNETTGEQGAIVEEMVAERVDKESPTKSKSTLVKRTGVPVEIFSVKEADEGFAEDYDAEVKRGSLHSALEKEENSNMPASATVKSEPEWKRSSMKDFVKSGKTSETRHNLSASSLPPAKSKTAQVKRRGLTPSDFPIDVAAGGIPGSRHNLGAYGVHFRADPNTVTVPEYSGRDNFESLEENAIKITSKEPVSTFSIDVDTASYSFVRRALNQGHLPQKDSVRIEELINYFDYSYAEAEDKDAPFEPTVALYPTPWNKETKLLHIGIKGYDIDKKERPRANLVFLIDVSGSMSSHDKLPLLKNSMKMLVSELNPDDTVAIAVYAGAAGTVLEPTKVTHKSKIIATLDRLNSGGSTAGGAGIKLAYALAESTFDKNAVNRVILATDGDFNVGIRNVEELKGFVERKRKSGVYLSVLGFGQGNYNDALMQKLAQNGNGNAAYIDTLSEARKVLVEESSGTLFTIAKDVKIQVEFNPERVAEYRLIGYESRALKREDFNNDSVDAGEIGSGHSVTAIYEITPVGSSSALVDPLRYGKEGKDKERVKAGKSAEYGFLKIRYKLPHEDKSRLITKPIDKGLEHNGIGSVPHEIRFAASVAAFAQLLKGGKYTGGFGYDDVSALARPVRGEDKFGYRSEFLSLIGLAKSADTMGNK